MKGKAEYVETPILLSLPLLLDITKDIKQALFYQAHLPPRAISKEACLVQLCVYNGSLRSCDIKEEATGRSLFFQQEQAARDALISLGMLEWYRVPFLPNMEEETPEPYLQPRSTPTSLGSMHQRIPIRREGNTEFSSHSLHQRVFFLVDGKRSVSQIATLLGKEPAEILRILHELQNFNLF